MSLREGRGVNIHMFCARRMGLLQSTLKTLDDLGLDIQQAVISCFNGFALDVFRAEVYVSNKIITLLDDHLEQRQLFFISSKAANLVSLLSPVVLKRGRQMYS